MGLVVSPTVVLTVTVRAGHLAIAGEPAIAEQHFPQLGARSVEVERERQRFDRLLPNRIVFVLGFQTSLLARSATGQIDDHEREQTREQQAHTHCYRPVTPHQTWCRLPEMAVSSNCSGPLDIVSNRVQSDRKR